MKRLYLMILVPLLLISVVGGCTPEQDTKIETREIAKQWVRERTETIATQIAESVIGKSPVLQSIAASRIKDLIKDKMGWDFSDPQKIGDDKYSVTAKAQTDFEVPLLGAYGVAVNFDLEIDTEKREVIHHLLNIGSLVISKRSK